MTDMVLSVTKGNGMHGVWRCVAVVAALGGLAACAGPQALDLSQSDRDDLVRASKVPVVHYQTPPTAFMTPASAVGRGLIATWTKSSEAPTWSQVVRQHRVPDPTVTVRDLLVQGLRSEGRLNNLVPETEALPLPVPENPAASKARYNAPYTLEIYTLGSRAGYEMFDWKSYLFSYAAQVRLIRQRDSQVVWKTLCSASAYKDDSLKLRIDDILGEDGAKVRQVYERATQQCARQLLDQYFGRKRSGT